MTETSYTKLYEELGLDSSRFRNLFKLLTTFFKIKTSGKREYHFNVIQIFLQYPKVYKNSPPFPPPNPPPPPPASNLTKKRTKRLIGSKLMQKFKWPNLIQYSGMASTHIGWPNQFSVHRIHMELRFVTKLRVCLSPFNEYRFNHNFQCCINPSCSCSLKTETISYLLLPCHHF